LSAEKKHLIYDESVVNNKKLTNASGTVVWSADYDPFGTATVTVSAVENNMRLPGQYYDSETGLHYNYHRYYDPSVGRYLTPDPIGLAGGINLYAYVGGNPVNRIDPLGLDYVNFDGQNLTWVFEKRAKILGVPMPWKEETGRKTWDAGSGHSPLYAPIPSGTYTTSPSNKELHTGDEYAWGPFSYRLHEGLTTRISNRFDGRAGGFHIHGGYREGTAGCIEFEDYEKEQKSLHEFDELIQKYGKEVKVYVK
jgi:RHS repeat-associated protein